MRKKYTQISITLAFVFLSLFAYAQEEALILEENEVWTDQVPVSGEIKVGIVEDFDNSAIDTKYFYVYLPDTKAKKLCVHISSRNGKFSAEKTYDIEKLKKNIWIKCPLGTKYVDKLKDFQSKDIVILAKVTDNCAVEGNGYVIARWDYDSNNNTKTENVILVVNSEKKPSIIVNGKKCLDCTIEKIASNDLVNYNHYCTIPKALLTLPSNNVTIVITEIIAGEISIVKFPLTLLK